MKKIINITLIVAMSLSLCSCGTESKKDTDPSPSETPFTEGEVALDSAEEKGEFPIKAAEQYECVRTDTTIHDSGLVYTEAVDDMLHVFIQQEEEEIFYEYCVFDMLEEKWTEPERCPWSENLRKIASSASVFHRDKDGNWYCKAVKTTGTKESVDHEYRICRLNDDGTVDVISLPKEVYGENDEIDNYDFVSDNTIMITLSEKGKMSSTVYKVCLVNIKTNEYEILSIYPGDMIPLVIGDEFFCTSYTDSSCGFLIRTKESNQPKREMLCENFVTMPHSATPFFHWPQICQDDGDNVYMVYDDGIYGGYCKDKKLGTIVNENMVPFMELKTKDGMAEIICSFDRGADMNQTDFYALIGIPQESGYASVSYELAHIKAADE